MTRGRGNVSETLLPFCSLLVVSAKQFEKLLAKKSSNPTYLWGKNDSKGKADMF